MNRMKPDDVWRHFKNRAKAVGWTYAELCRRANVHPSTVAMWRIGRANPILETTNKLVAVLEPIEQALGLSPGDDE